MDCWGGFFFWVFSTPYFFLSPGKLNQPADPNRLAKGMPIRQHRRDHNRIAITSLVWVHVPRTGLSLMEPGASAQRTCRMFHGMDKHF